MTPVKRKILAQAAARKVISQHPVQQPDPSTIDQTVGASVDVQPAPLEDAPLNPNIDQLQAVDYIGDPIKVGDVVDIYSCKVVGLRPDPNNRLNVWVIPLFNNIITPDPNNPLFDQVDQKAILVSGFNTTIIFSPTATGAQRAAGIDAALAVIAEREANPVPGVTLPSNFLAPSIT